MSIFYKKFSTPAYFDFGDGLGKVPAHQHCFGSGWVADTAKVADTVYVGPCAHVHGNAEIDGMVTISGNADVGGNARLHDNVAVGGDASVQGFALVEGHVFLGGACFVSGSVHLDGNTRLEKTEVCAGTTSRCFECPLFSADNYGATHENPCIGCMSRIMHQAGDIPGLEVAPH